MHIHIEVHNPTKMFIHTYTEAEKWSERRKRSLADIIYVMLRLN